VAGAAKPAGVGWRVPALVLGLVLVMAAVGLGFALASRNDTVAGRPGGGDPTQPAGVSSAAGQSNAGSSPDTGGIAATTTDPAQPLDAASAKAALDAELARDQNPAEQLVGHWLPQLSSKRPGLVADGITYDYPQIWANFVHLRAEHPDVLLIWSGNYVSYQLTDFYVTIDPMPYGDGQSANQWCDDNGFPPNDCYATFLSHNGGSNGTSLLRQ
jgi:serine/threonine-protein kinase